MASRTLEEEFQDLVQSRAGAIADPYSIYARLRREAPVFRYSDQVVVSAYEPVSRTLLDASRFLSGTAELRGSRVRASLAAVLDSEQRRKMIEILEFRGGGLNWMNGETHHRLRALAHAAFTPRTVRDMEDRIQAIVDELLEPVSTTGEMEVVSEFAFQLPLIVISDMLDIPRDDRYLIRQWTNDIAAFQDGANPAVVDDTHTSIFALRDHLKAIFARRRGTSTTDLMGALLAAEGEGGDCFSEDELVPVVAHFVFAGHETTTNLIANGLRALLIDFREQWQLLCEEPSRASKAVEELLRYDSPVQIANRTAATDCEIDGVAVDRWNTVTLILGAANRDPSRFPNPDTVDLSRGDAKHVGFGLGPHFCLGAALTRVEARIALETLARRFPSLRVAAETIDYRPDHRLRGVDSLPVTAA